MAHLPTARSWSSPITEQKPHVGVLHSATAEGLGAMLRWHGLTEDLQDRLGARALPLADDVPPGAALAGVDMLVIDGPVPDPMGPVSGVVPRPLNELGASLRWLVVALLALRRGLPTVFHDFDYRDPLPAWAVPLIAGVLNGATRVLVASDDAEQRTRRIAPDATIERIAHPLSRLKAPTNSMDEDRYWLLDVTPTGMDHGVTMKTVVRVAREQAIRLVRVRTGPLQEGRTAESRTVILGDIAPHDAISLVAGAAGVVLASRDLAAAAGALGVPTFPQVDPRSGAWVAQPPELVSDQLLAQALNRPADPIPSGESTLRRPDWRAIYTRATDSARDGANLDPLIAELPDHLAGVARQGRMARFEQVIMRSEVSRAGRKTRQLQQTLVETRAERATLRGQLERAQAARQVATEAMAEYRQKLRRTETRVENLTETVGLLRAKLEQQTQASQEALAELREENRSILPRLDRAEAEQHRLASQASAAQEKYERLLDRKAVRVALAAAGWWGRLSGKR